MTRARVLLGALALASAPASALEPSCHAAADVLAPALLSGPWHTVDPCVRVVGHLWRFELHTTTGRRVVDSKELLAIRVEELPAEAALAALGTPEIGVRAFGLRGYEHGQRLGPIARHPIATLKALPRGVRAFFERRAAKYAGRARKYADRARDAATGAGDHYDAPSARPGVVARDARGARSLAAKAGRELERQLRSELSFNATRRRWAQRLGVDPYSTNDRLRAELERVTWAAIVGQTAADAALAQLPGSVLAALDVAKDVHEHIWQVPPEDLARRNGERLAAIGCSALETRRFLRNGAFTPTLQLALVDALEALEPGERCDEIVDLATALRGEVEARYLVNALGLLDRWAPDTNHRSLELIGTTPVARSSARADDTRGRPDLVLPLAVDRLQWNRATRAFFDQPALRVAHKLAIVSGELSPRAARGLARRGWSVVEQAGHDGATAALSSPSLE
ncbi:MAG TPA: hypothetical protein VND91_12035 [Candidatus Saccharimonadia bacterium]|nr:hypothetical protein [Candidatus Saccharimonadia bacterium]